MSEARVQTCRSWASVWFIACVLVVAGCSKSNAPATSANKPASGGAGTAAITKERAATYTQAVNLRPRDVPGLVAVASSHASENQPLGGIESCDATTVSPGGVVAVGSQTFQRQQGRTDGSTSYLPLEAVLSGVYVMRSTALADQEIEAVQAAASSPSVVSCLKRQLMSERATVSSEGSTTGVPAGKPLFSHVEVSALPSPLQNIPHFGLRISAEFAIKVPGTSGRSRYYQEFIGFPVGAAVIVLRDTGSPKPIPTATARRLLSLLYSRAKEHSP